MKAEEATVGAVRTRGDAAIGGGGGAAFAHTHTHDAPNHRCDRIGKVVGPYEVIHLEERHPREQRYRQRC